MPVTTTCSTALPSCARAGAAVAMAMRLTDAAMTDLWKLFILGFSPLCRAVDPEPNPKPNLVPIFWEDPQKWVLLRPRERTVTEIFRMTRPKRNQLRTRL